MWNMRWKLISLSTTLLTVISAQVLTTDDVHIIQGPDNVTSLTDHNDTFADNYVEQDNDTSINSITDNNAPPSTGRGLIFDIIPKNDENHELTNSDVSSDARPVPSSDTKETIEDSSPNEPLPSKEISKSEETSGEVSNSQESIEQPGKPLSSENVSEEKSNSEDTNEIPISKQSESYEKESEKESVEESISSENPDSGAPPASRSKESESGGNTAEQPCSEIEEHLVQTTHGPVKGHLWQKDMDIIGFIDIPYGKINRPFEPPVSSQSWEDVHYITEHTKVCPQLHNDGYIGETDCLTLSIFASKDAENHSVLFHIYDGYSNIKSADPSIYGPEYLVPKGVILVLPNYRVGPLGFLCMQNETVPGNAALKDLSLALEWVKDNIRFFGGNPANIAVSGDGAAGAYAGCLALCSRSRYYINKVITESGSALSHWALDRDPLGTAGKLAEKIRRERDDGIIYNNTFAEVSIDTIVKAAKGMRLNPCLEHDKEPFMNNTPWAMLQNKDIDITFMIGSASFAGAHEAMAATEDFIAQLNIDFGQILPEDLVFKNDDERKEYAQKLKTQYFGDANITAHNMEELSLWYTDASYLGPGIRLARPLLAAGATVYLYEFAFVGNLNRELEAMNKPVSGAVRSDIVGYLFCKNDTTVEEDSPEEHMISLMSDLWINFINTGKPQAADVKWNELKETEESEEEWLLISTEAKAKKGIHVDRLRLWTSLYDRRFIENSSAPLGSSRSPLALALAIFCWIVNSKLNYSSR